MTRRELLGCLLLVVLVLGGRLVRQTLMDDPAGGWREPGWLAERLPARPESGGPASVPAVRRPPPRLDPNISPADSLTLLPGIGPALAGRIVAARLEGVQFACARDLQAIRGIGPRTVERLEPYLVFTERDSAH